METEDQKDTSDSDIDSIFNMESRTESKKDSNGSNSAAAISKEDDRTAFDWLRSIGTSSNIRITVIRAQPKTFRGKQTGGIVDVVDEVFDEEWLKEKHGGGKYYIRVQKIGKTGKYEYGGQRMVEIAGDPLLPHDGTVETVAVNNDDPSLTKKAMDLTERVMQQAQTRAEKLEDEMRKASSKPGYDPVLMDAILTPLRDQTRMAQEESRELRKQVTEMITKKPEPTATDKLLEKFIDGESARITALKTQQESELRSLRDHSREEVKRAEDRLQKLLETQERSHEREVANLKSSLENQINVLRLGYENQISTQKFAYESQLATLTRENDRFGKEIVELRAKKDVPLEEQVSRMMQIKDLFGAFGGGNDAEEDPVWKQVTDTVMNSELAKGIAKRVAGDAAAVQNAAQPQRALTGRKLRPRLPQGAATAVAPTNGTPRPVAPVAAPLNTGEVATAVTFIETAISNGTEPETFASTARALVPAEILGAIKTQGVDKFLEVNVKLTEDSPLSTMAGKNFIRKVARILTEDAN